MVAPHRASTSRPHPDDGDPVARVHAAARALADRAGGRPPRTALLLATGSSSARAALRQTFDVPAAELPGDVRLGGPDGGEDGAFTFGEGADGSGLVICDVGAGHGTDPFEATLPIRVLHGMGVRRLLFAAAGASLVPHLDPATLVIARDHIDFSGRGDLRGPHGSVLPAAAGPLYPDLTHAYSPSLRARARATGSCVEAVVASVGGPQMPTPAESRFHAHAGAEVAASAIAEKAVVAAQCGLEFAAFIAVVQRIDPDTPELADVEAMADAADHIAPVLTRTLLDLA